MLSAYIASQEARSRTEIRQRRSGSGTMSRSLAATDISAAPNVKTSGEGHFAVVLPLACCIGFNHARIRVHKDNISSRPPRGGRPQTIMSALDRASCFNPRPPRGGRQPTAPTEGMSGTVSIHAPRAGGDVSSLQLVRHQVSVSIHAPRAGGDAPCATYHRRGRTVSIHAPRAGGDADARRVSIRR